MCGWLFVFSTLILSHNHHSTLPAATQPNVWVAGYVGYINTINEPTEHGN